jgi:hypothetical protein
MKIRKVATWTNPKHGAAAPVAILARPALEGRPVEIAVATQDQRSKWGTPVSAVKLEKICQVTGRTNAEHGAIAAVSPTFPGRAIETTVAALH